MVRLTEAASGRTLTVQVGTKIHLELHPTAGSYDPPQVDQPGVLREDAHHGGYPQSSTAVADFTTLARGSATITSQTDMACLHTTRRCLPPQRGFSVAIAVR